MARHFCRWDPQAKILGLRFSNVMEPAEYLAFPGFDADPALRRWNLWGYIDARDGAQAVRRALQADLTGADVFVIANADTVMSRPNAELAAQTYPGVPYDGHRGPERHAAGDRQGAQRAGLRARALLARRRLGRLTAEALG
jgi:nucleoside-diphosphate-sugar epimerase